MALKLRELDRFLGNGKMRFERRDESRHIGFLVRVGDECLGLPTLLRVSHGSGDADFTNIKGVAAALGLNVRELENAEACRLRRECILIMLAVHLLLFSVQRRTFIRDTQDGIAGVLAMVESVSGLLQLPEVTATHLWKAEELKAFSRIRVSVEKLAADELTSKSAQKIVSLISRG
jgi:hypothetical protein